MSSGSFQKIGLFAKYRSTHSAETFKNLFNFLKRRGHTVYVEAQSAALLSEVQCTIIPQAQLGTYSDLVIVVGGDGSLLNAARSIVHHQVPILGVNRGRLGFLADIRPDEFEKKLSAILEGAYIQESRSLLQATIYRSGQPITLASALNDVVLYTGSVARMIEFEVHINEKFVLKQRSDGLITATPTGSTAYALSGGGPILYPTLNAIVLVPMFPHTLSNRPIVVDDSSQITLIISESNEISPKLSCDGQVHIDLQPETKVLIEKHPYTLHLIHPADYNYYAVLQQKLGWNTDCQGGG